MSESAIGVGMIGCGTVGGGVIELLRACGPLYARRLGRPVELRRVLVRDAAAAVRRTGLDADLITDEPEAFFATGRMPIVLEAAGGRGTVSAHVRRALESGRHVVTANKSLLAAEGPALFELARRRGVALAFEASCGGGIPCITALQAGLMANRIQGLYGILNGTCNYILTRMTRQGASYDAALADAQARGFAEADPALDVSGRDAAEKLTILACLAFGVRIVGEQVGARGIDDLELEDLRFGAELGYDIKLLAIAEAQADAGATQNESAPSISAGVEPCFIHHGDLLAQVHGAFNALSVHGHAVGHTMYYGQGAGRLPTASALVSDLLNLAGGGYAAAFANMRLTPDCHAPLEPMDAGELVSRFYLRLHALDVPGVMAKVTRVLGEAGIGLSAVLQHEAAAGEFVPVVITTHEARRGDLDAAVAAIEKLAEIRGRPVVIRIADIPE